MDFSFLHSIFLPFAILVDVSILVLMDFSFLQKYEEHRRKLLIDKFQSLFLWIFRSYNKLLIEIPNAAEYVSILVLMDFSFLRETQKKQLNVTLRSFNPCSYGFFVLTK